MLSSISVFLVKFWYEIMYTGQLYSVDQSFWVAEITYSRVHKSSDSFFSKILEKPSIVQKKNDPS